MFRKFSHFSPFLFFRPFFFSFLSSFLLPPSSFLPSRTTSSHEQGDNTEQPGPSPPPTAPLAPPSRTHLSPSPSLPSPASSPMIGHGAPTSAMAALPWRALTKVVFLRGATKTDAHDLPLAITALNFNQNEL
jgi:hypothetical protein